VEFTPGIAIVIVLYWAKFINRRFYLT